MRPQTIFMTVLVVLFVLLQYKLWFSEEGYRQYIRLKEKLLEAAEYNAELQRKNLQGVMEVDNLKQGDSVVEELARHELGLVKPGETFYHIVE